MIKNSIHLDLFRKLAIIMLIFSVCRLLFYFFYLHHFPGLSGLELLKIMFYGLRYDIAAISLINAPVILFLTLPFNFRFNKYYLLSVNALFYVLNGIGVIANCIDLAYFRFTLKRTTSDIFVTKGMGNDIFNLIPAFLKDFWYVLLVFILLVLTMIYLNKKFNKKLIKPANAFWPHVMQFLLFVAIMSSAFVASRGGLQLRPLNIISAGKYADVNNIPLVINTPFALISTLGKNAINPYAYFDEDEIRKFRTTVKTPNPLNKFEPKNVVVIILEGFSSEHIGALNKDISNENYRGYTPFLDSLMEHSLVFANNFANGKKSIEGVPAILAGIPALMDMPYPSSVYSANRINGLPALLSEKDYSSAFFHGGNNGTMGFDAFAKTAGFDKYFGRNEYPGDEYDGKWGIWDEEYMQYCKVIMDDMKQPFITAIFTLSSHHPFKVPARYEGVFPTGPLPVHKTIGYTDYALKKFFQAARTSDWYKNTVFVITADHTSDAFLPEFMTRSGIYKVPLIFFADNGIKPEYVTSVTQHIDIMPSVLDILKYDKTYYSLGNSVMDTLAPRFAVNYLNNTFQIIENNYALEFDGDKSLSLYNIKTDKLHKNNLLYSETEIAGLLERKLKLFLQMFSRDLRSNDMIIN